MTAVGEQRGGVLLGRYRCCTVMLQRHLQMPSSAVAWPRRQASDVDQGGMGFFLRLVLYGAMQSDVGIMENLMERSFPLLPTGKFNFSGFGASTESRSVT